MSLQKEKVREQQFENNDVKIDEIMVETNRPAAIIHRAVQKPCWIRTTADDSVPPVKMVLLTWYLCSLSAWN